MDEIKRKAAGQYLTFKMGNEQYGADVADIKEVLEVPQITRVPNMPEFVEGVINLRGSIVPVIDLRLRFGLGGIEPKTAAGIIVMEFEDFQEEDGDRIKLTIGIFADSVQKVITLEADQIDPVPKIGINTDSSFIHGIGKSGNDFIMIMNIHKILTTRELHKIKKL